jgi:hypothetical protein
VALEAGGSGCQGRFICLSLLSGRGCQGRSIYFSLLVGVMQIIRGEVQKGLLPPVALYLAAAQQRAKENQTAGFVEVGGSRLGTV